MEQRRPHRTHELESIGPPLNMNAVHLHVWYDAAVVVIATANWFFYPQFDKVSHHSALNQLGLDIDYELKRKSEKEQQQ